MVKSELIKRSPLRVFEKTIHGGLGKGNIGVLCSKKGVGKTACLVHIATDQLLQNKHVIHVSFSARIDHIISWYEDIFREIAKKRNLESAVEVHDEIIKNRVIMCFNQHGVTAEQILRSLSAMIRDGNFHADTVIFDGYDLGIAAPEDLEKIRLFAEASKLDVWFSVSLEENTEFDERRIPRMLLPRLGSIAVLIGLDYAGDHVKLEVLKDHSDVAPKDMNLMLDPKTLLIAEEA